MGDLIPGGKILPKRLGPLPLDVDATLAQIRDVGEGGRAQIERAVRATGALVHDSHGHLAFGTLDVSALAAVTATAVLGLVEGGDELVVIVVVAARAEAHV